MTTALVVVAAGTALACPSHALWRLSRGRESCCVPPVNDATSIHQRQRALAARLARFRSMGRQ